MLKIGDSAPDFNLPDKERKNFSLSDFRGKKLVLFFYPKDNTSGCTMEARDFTKLKPDFEKENAGIVGISKDSPESHREFIEKRELSLTLLSDESAEVQKKYDVWKKKKFMGKEYMGTVRTTFLIDENGKISKIWNHVKALGHAEQVLEEIKRK